MAWLGRSWGLPVVPTNNLHAIPTFAVLYQTTNFVRKWWEGGGGGGAGGGFKGFIIFAAYSWNTILRPVPRKMIKFKINFDTVELQKTYGKIKVFEKLIMDFFALQI